MHTGGNEPSPCTNELTCPMCNQPVGPNIDELAKHLVLVHLVPFPSVLTFLSTSMLTNQLCANREIQHLSSTRPPNLEWEPTQTPMSTIALPSVMSASVRGSEKSLKREHSPTDSLNKYNKPPVMKRTESMPIHYQTKPGGSGYFTCPQCTAGFPSVYHLQLHFIQDHAMEFGNMFNLSAALAGTTRLPQPFSPQLLAQFSNSLAVPTSMANTCIPRPTFAPLMEHVTNVSKPDTLPDILARPIRSEENRRLESEASSIAGPFGAASNLMNLPFAAAAAAAAFGLPFISDYPVTSSQSGIPESCNTSTQAALQGFALTGLRSDRNSEFQLKNNIGSTNTNSKRSRMEASSMETASSHPSG
ncbi:hypothetical protein AHF37_04620 [Paragonimus kellicotti]|nr:hypothetical protein AHF37_04620 [Paragonimus kellicotti]